ncbi:Seg-like homing endonuclease protein [Rhizobium phage RHph_X2_25]|nr:Seg-like homing endonuclease protein [Rhizobium phage RHph_X2_25]
MEFTKKQSGAPVAANDNNEFRFYVYAWLYPDGSPFYVGKGSGRRDKQPKRTNVIFKHIVAKIRREGGEPSVVRWQEGLREDDAHRLEMAYIRLFGRRNIGTGVLSNLSDGGEGRSGAIVGVEARAKLSESKRGSLNPNFGKPLSEETKAKLSESKRGKTHTDEARAKIGDAFRGKALSAEHREKISAALRGGAKRGGMHTAEAREKVSRAMRMLPPKDGFKGIHASKNKWRAEIRIRGKKHRLGFFSSPEDAARAYDKAAIEAWGFGNCYLNFGMPQPNASCK